MTSFTADPNTIREFANTVSDLSENAQDVPGYVEQWVALSYNDGRMFAEIKSASDNALQSLTDNFNHLASISSSSSGQLDLAADHYEATDSSAAADLDADYAAE